jgi:flagellar biosynthetic protein FlhB
VAEDSDSGEKTEEPTQYRIEEFRKQGQVASSKELTSVLILFAAIITLGFTIVYIYENLSAYIEWLYFQNAQDIYQELKFKKLIEHTAFTAFKSVGPLFLIVFTVGFLANVAQVGWLFSPDVLTLKIERLNPLEGIKKLFSVKSLVTAVKGIFKFSIIMGITYFVMQTQLPKYMGFLHSDFANTFMFGKDMLIQLTLSIVTGLILVAIGDFAWEKYSYKKKLMMTKEQAKKEHKEHEGNPEIKQKIKSIQREISQRRMIAKVPEADVIVTNPTHISIMLKYDTESMVSPQVIGKGADYLAMRIREIAREHNIPIVENIPLARTMYKTVKVGAFVPRNLYKAIAEVLAFVYKLKKKQKAISTGESVSG